MKFVGFISQKWMNISNFMSSIVLRRQLELRAVDLLRPGT